MKRVVFSSLWIAFHGSMLSMTYWGPIKEWFSFKVRLSNSAAPKTAPSRNAWTKVVKQKTFFTFSRMRRQKSPLFTEPVPEVFEFRFADWAEKYFSAQSARSSSRVTLLPSYTI